MKRLQDLKVKIFGDGADKQSILDLYKNPLIIGPPRSACRVSWPGATLCLTMALSNKGLNSAALSASAICQATILRLKISMMHRDRNSSISPAPSTS